MTRKATPYFKGYEVNQHYGEGCIKAVAFTPDGELLISSSSCKVRALDLRNGHSFELKPKGSDSVAFSPDGKKMVSPKTGEFAVWDLFENEKLSWLRRDEGLGKGVDVFCGWQAAGVKSTR